MGSSSIHIDILLDNFPIETGWSLTCGGDLRAYFPTRTYYERKQNIIQSFDVNYNVLCPFIIVDDAEDGICCSNGDGRYIISTLIGNSTTTIIRNGDFGAKREDLFFTNGTLVA